MNKILKSLALTVFTVTSFGLSHQTANAKTLVCDGFGDTCKSIVCPLGLIETETFSSGRVVVNCLSSAEFCLGREQYFRDFELSFACPDYQNNRSWIEHIATSTTSSSSGGSVTTTVPSSGGSVTTTVPSSGGSVTTTVPSSGGSSSKSVTRIATTTTEVPVVEDDGDSEGDYADIGISSKGGKFDIRVSSSLGETEMTLRAYKKNSKSITWSFTTYSSGNYRIITSRALKGFTVSLWIDGEKWDSLVVR